MGLPQGLVTQSSACVPTQGWGCTWGGSSREDSLCPRPGLGVPAGLSREEGLRPPPRGWWGTYGVCPEKRAWGAQQRWGPAHRLQWGRGPEANQTQTR